MILRGKKIIKLKNKIKIEHHIRNNDDSSVEEKLKKYKYKLEKVQN